MPVQYWETVANAGAPYQSAAGTPYAASVSLTDVSPAPQITIPANFYYPGQLWRMTAFGIYSTTSAPTLLIGFYYGGAAGVALCATTATAVGNSQTNLTWQAQATVRIVSLGSSGSANAIGSFTYGTSTSGNATLMMPASSSTGNLVTIDTTTAKTWTVAAQWGTNNASNTLTCYEFILETLS